MGRLKSLEELFEGRHFDREVIILCVRWYLRFKLTLQDLVEIGRARPVDGAYDHYALGAALCTRVREALVTVAQAVGRSWRVDETYVKIRGAWFYLYRAVDRAFQAERHARRRGRQGVLPQSDQEPAACPADNHAGRLCRISSCGARAESRWLVARGHQAALVEVPEQPD